MPITDSSYRRDNNPQRCGRYRVIETHTLNIGAPKVIEYLAAIGADYATIMANRVPIINAGLVDEECANNLASIYNNEMVGTALVITYNHVLRADFIVWLRRIYMVLTQNQCAIVGNWMKLNVTDAEAKAIFGVTDAQLTALKAKFTSDYNKWTAIKAVEGQ